MISVKDGGSWKPTNEIYVKDGGVWKPTSQVFMKQNGVWVPIWSSDTTIHDMVIGYRPDTSVGKMFSPERRGYWGIDTSSSALTNNTSTQTLTISEADYIELYNAGLVDVPLAEYFTQPSDTFGTSNLGSGGSELVPTNGFDGRFINGIYEGSLNRVTTQGSFTLEVAGHDTPSTWFQRVEVYNGTTLTNTFLRSASENIGGQNITTTSDDAFRTWTWPVARGAVFPTSGNRIIRIHR